MDEQQNKIDELKHQAVSILYRLIRLRMDVSRRERILPSRPSRTRLYASPSSPIALAPIRTSVLVDVRPSGIKRLPHVTRPNIRRIDQPIVLPSVVSREQHHPPFPRLPQLQFSPRVPRCPVLTRHKNIGGIRSSKVMRSPRLHRARSPIRSISPPLFTNVPLKSHLISSDLRSPPGRVGNLTSPRFYLPPEDSILHHGRQKEDYCFPSRPLIHSRQRPHVSRFVTNTENLPSPFRDDIVYWQTTRRSDGSSTSAPWSPSLSDGPSVRENILVSYYTKPRAIQERIPKIRSSSRVVKRELTDFTQDKTIAKSTLDERSRTSEHVTLPRIEKEKHQPENNTAEPKEPEKLPSIHQRSSESEITTAAADEDSGSTGVTTESTAAPFVDHRVNKEGTESSYKLADANGETAEKMKGMKQETSTQAADDSSQQTEKGGMKEKVDEKVVHQMGCCGGSPAAIHDDEQLQRPPGQVAPKEVAWLPVNTCVSIVIETVEEEDIPEPQEMDEQFEPDSEHPLEQAVEEEDSVTNPEIKLQSILDYVKNRRHEFAKLLEEHAEIVHEINKFEGGVTS